MSTDLIQIIKPDGTLAAKKAPRLSKTVMLELFRVMVTTRMLDERCMRLQRSGRIGFYVPSGGQEAASIGSAAALELDDWIFPSYRSPGIPILRGVPIADMLHNCYGNDSDRAKGRQMPVHYSFKDAGFVSIGCQPCTRAVGPHEHERAGRWWWEEATRKECGLHAPQAVRIVGKSA